MKLMLADIQKDALDEAVEEARAVHLLFNNAGVAGCGGFVWEASPKDWQWVLAGAATPHRAPRRAETRDHDG
jgi:NADP-dependent 3-hydroxy acid dehydrogenase YdfG